MSDNLINSERSLLKKVATGDEFAFGKLFKAHYNQLGEFIMRLIESEQLTQEIVQDAFLKIWINRVTLPEITCFKAYLFIIARNHAFNCLKQISREKSREKDWVNTVLHQAVNTVEEPESIDTGKLMDEAVELLPSQQKKVYTLSRRHGVRQHQIARELNISHETVKKHLMLAIRFLKNHLRANFGIIMLVLEPFFSQ